MEQVEYEEEEAVWSAGKREEQETMDFRRYLVESGCVMHFVKFLLGLRSKQKHDEGAPSEDVLEMFKEYIGAVKIDTTHHDQLKQDIAGVEAENARLREELKGVKQQIQTIKEERQQAKEEKRLKEEEEARNPKKAGKK